MWDSVWFRTLAPSDSEELRASDALPSRAEVLIVGGGLIGLFTAHFLLEAGIRDVCVVDRTAALAEASGANAGMLWFARETEELGPLAPLARASRQIYQHLAQDPQFAFEFRQTGLIELYEPAEEDRKRRMAEAARRAGYAAEFVSPQELSSLEPALRSATLSGVYFPEEACLHPVKLGVGLLRRLRQRGAKVCAGTEVLQLIPRVMTSRGPIQAEVVVLATGAWTADLVRPLGWEPPIRPVRGQLLYTAPQPRLLAHIVHGPRYYYLQAASGHVIAGGTAEEVGFERGVRTEDLDAIRAEMAALLPELKGTPVEGAWSGFRPQCGDGYPIIGRVPGRDKIWVAAGHFRKGVLLAPATGFVLAELIRGGSSELWTETLDPARFPRR